MNPCGAKTRSGGVCQKSPIVGKRRCRLHGGLSLSGVLHPNYRHGNRSQARIEQVRSGREKLRLLQQLCQQLGMFEKT